ncbi:hypothetical protein Cgig2_021916 [Carnegiea gigantea]|uniref:Uncharacterized protein n=1 Tax=Carnegiea gigantea TaxID=171969 RepID=A0A9Q1GSJ8_9CARY|nr:hypothetical protein Cgig2_021916 [Carnegiea gigantea]
MQRNTLLPFDYFLDSFIGRLKPHLKSFVTAFNLQGLSEVVEYARVREGYVAALLSNPRNEGGRTTPPNLSTFGNKPTKVLTVAKRVDKMAQGLNFFCDKPYERAHKCGNKTTQLFFVEVPGEDEEQNGQEVGQAKEFVKELEFDLGNLNLNFLCVL